MDKPMLVFDGECAFCRRWIVRWRRLTGDRVEYVPFQEVAPRFPQISREQFEEAVQWIGPDGRVASAAHAVFLSLSVRAVFKPLLWAYRHLPGFARVSEAAYHWVSEHRMSLSRFS